MTPLLTAPTGAGPAPPPAPSPQRILAAYRRHLTAAGRAPATIKLRTRYAGRYLDANPYPATATRADLDTWLAAHEWSRATRRSAIATLRDFHAWLHTTGYAPTDPAAALHAPPEPAPCARACPDAALEAGLRATSGTAHLLLRLAADTGLRRAELARVRGLDVDGRWLTVRGKGGRIRRVPLPPDLATAIAADDSWTFPGRFTGHASVDWVHDTIHRATGWPPHALRHRYARRAYTATRDVRAVQALLGHASLATTQRYLGIDDDQLTAAAGAVWHTRTAS